MRNIKYTSGTGRRTFDLNKEIIIGDPNALHSRTWSYDLGARTISGLSRNAREASIKAVFKTHEVADNFRRYCDRDIANKTPGTLEVDGWTQRVYFVAAEADSLRGMEKRTLTVVLLDGVWRKAHTVEFGVSSDVEDLNALDYPYDFNFDYGAVNQANEIVVPEWSEVPASIRVYGVANNPEIKIGGNIYRVNTNVPNGATLVTDPVASPKRVYIKLNDGAEVDAFPQAARGSGVGSGSYIFEKLKPGKNQAEWDNTFKFDVVWFEEDTEPSWS